jgi:sulfonate transport system ATP-binding protein
VGLPGIRDALPKQLSGGMAQRVALARGLFSKPDLLLLDEPFSAVDAITRSRLQDLLLTLARSRGTAALIVTHDLDEAVYLSDRVLVLAPPCLGSASRLTLDVAVTSARPRDRRDAKLDALRDVLMSGIGANWIT